MLQGSSLANYVGSFSISSPLFFRGIEKPCLLPLINTGNKDKLKHIINLGFLKKINVSPSPNQQSIQFTKPIPQPRILGLLSTMTTWTKQMTSSSSSTKSSPLPNHCATQAIGLTICSTTMLGTSGRRILTTFTRYISMHEKAQLWSHNLY